jgi:hypothetical protein
MSENGVVDEVEEFLRERSRELTTPRAGRLAREAAAMRGRASRRLGARAAMVTGGRPAKARMKPGVGQRSATGV